MRLSRAQVRQPHFADTVRKMLIESGMHQRGIVCKALLHYDARIKGLQTCEGYFRDHIDRDRKGTGNV